MYYRNTDYRSQGVHKNRDTTAKTRVEAMDREGVTDAQKEEIRNQAAEATVAAAAEAAKPQNIAVDEPAMPAAKKDTTTQVVKSGHKASDKTAQRVEPGKYEILKGPGSGYDSGWGREGTQSNPAADRGGDVGGEQVIDMENLQSQEAMSFGGGFGMMDQMGGMMGGMGGGGESGGGTSGMDAGAGGGGGGMGGMMGGGGEGGGGGGMMGGLPSQVGKDIASKDDSIDRADNELLMDDADIEAHQKLGEALQGRS